MTPIIALALVGSATFDITQFGASSGPGDDSRAIQRALDQAAKSGGVVRIPAGTFDANMLEVGSNTTIEGVGESSILKRPDGERGRMIQINLVSGPNARKAEVVRNVTIRNLTLKDNIATDGPDTAADIMGLNGTENVLIEGVRFIGFRRDGIYVGGGDGKGILRRNKGFTVRNSIFDGVNKKNRNAISIIDGTDVRIERNRFVRCTSTSNPGQVDFEPNKNAEYRVQNAFVLDNTFDDNNGNAIVIDIPKDQNDLAVPIRNIQIKRNKISNQTMRGILVYSVSQMGSNTPAFGLSIQDNTIENAKVGIAVEGIKGAVISGNSIRNASEGMIIGWGPAGRGVADVTIEGNTLTKVGHSVEKNGGAAFVVFNAKGISILNNTVTDSVGANGQAGALVKFRASKGGGFVTNAKIEGNKMGFGSRRPSGKAELITVERGSSANPGSMSRRNNAIQN